MIEILEGIGLHLAHDHLMLAKIFKCVKWINPVLVWVRGLTHGGLSVASFKGFGIVGNWHRVKKIHSKQEGLSLEKNNPNKHAFAF
ncbi:hypothetical protein [Helicobacter bizzozeronii]|uniref:hypothetical protein n=1 Tax=Helicobacter bizzozeronii TaxID=56877 RepID=UPI0018F833F8|nr:hypothetical protein [Helicobacter bizzozeronii]